jgi:ribosome-associated protein
METFKLTEEYIQLNQLLKAMSWCENGAQANAVIDNGLVKVNGETEYRKRNKLKDGFVVEFQGKRVTIENEK